MKLNAVALAIFLLLVLSNQQTGGDSGGYSSESYTTEGGQYGNDGSEGGSGSGISGGAIAGIVVGCILGLVLITVSFICCFVNRARRQAAQQVQDPSSMQGLGGNYVQQRFDFFMCSYADKAEKIELDESDRNLNTSAQMLERILRAAIGSTGKFSFWQRERQFLAQITEFDLRKSVTKRHVFDIFLRGMDQYGSWIAKGLLLYTRDGPYLCWRKHYQNKIAVRHTGQLSVLIYESIYLNEGMLMGIWFFNGMKGSAEFSGNWRIQKLMPVGSEINPLELCQSKDKIEV